MHREHVEIAFAEDRDAFAPELDARLVQAEEQIALLVERALRAVHVLRRRIARDLVTCGQLERAAAERDDLSVHVGDGEHQAVAEAIVVAVSALAGDDQAGLFAFGEREAARAEVLRETIPAVWCVAEAVGRHGLVLHRALVELGAREMRVWVLAQHADEVARGRLGDRGEALALLAFAADRIVLARLDLGQLDARAVGELAQRLGEGLALELHHELEDVPRGLAAEAVEELPLRVHVERRRLLRVEGAEALEARARALEHDVLADELHDVRALADLRDFVVSDHEDRRSFTDGPPAQAGRVTCPSGQSPSSGS